MEFTQLINKIPMLTLIMALPFLAGSTIVLFFHRRTTVASLIALGTMSVTGLLSLGIWFKFRTIVAGYQFVERLQWIPELGIEYTLGVDGLSVSLIPFVLLIAMICLVVARKSRAEHDPRFYASFLMMTSMTLGMLLAYDAFLFIIFWGASSIPMYGLLSGDRDKTSRTSGVRYFIVNLIALVLLLFAFSLIAHTCKQITGQYSFNLESLKNLAVPANIQIWIFWSMLLAFFIRSAMFPFHSWLNEILSETDGAVTIFLLAVSTKIGIYGLIRFCLPLATSTAINSAGVINYIALIAIVYGALIALMQPEMDRIIGFVNLSATGWMVLGGFSLSRSGFDGALVHIIGFGAGVALLLVLTGWLKDAFGSSLVMDYGGLSRRVPYFSGLFIIAVFTCAGIPGSSGFPGIFLVINSVIFTQLTGVIIAAVGWIICGAGMIALHHRLFQGEASNLVTARSEAIRFRNWLVSLSLVAVIAAIGLYPQMILVRSRGYTRSLEISVESHQILSSGKSPPMGHNLRSLSNLQQEKTRSKKAQ